MYDVNDWKKYKIGPWSLKSQHQRRRRGQDGDGNEGKVSEEMEQHVRNCLHLGFEFQLKLRHLRVDKLTKALVSKDDDEVENSFSLNDPLEDVPEGNEDNLSEENSFDMDNLSLDPNAATNDDGGELFGA